MRIFSQYAMELVLCFVLLDSHFSHIICKVSGASQLLSSTEIDENIINFVPSKKRIKIEMYWGHDAFVVLVSVTILIF